MANPPSMANMMPDGDWRLSFDVVSSVMAASPPPTISAFMQSCHALYEEGPRHLLRDGVGLYSEDQVVLFTNFMLTKDPSRLAHLRKLELAFSHFKSSPLPFLLLFSDETRLRLGQLLLHPALGLETLILHGVALLLSSSSLSDTALCQAFRRLNTIKHLVLLGVGAESGPIIRTLPSKLESVSMSVDRPLIEGPGWARFEVLPTLRPFSDTLHTLLVKLEPSAPALSLLTNAGSYGFPHVRTFGIVSDDSVPALFASPAFAQTFPALTNLQLIPATHDRSGRHRGRRLETAERLREGSQVRRSQHPGGSAFPALSSLVECSGRLFDVYALAFDHTLSTLRLWQHVAAEDLHVLGAVLEDTRPGRLCLSTEMDNVGTTFATLRALLARPPPRVDLNISLSWTFWRSLYAEGALRRFCGFLAALVQPLPPGLVELNLLVDFPSDARPAERSVVSDNLGAFAKWASTGAPSLALSCRVAVDGDWQWPDLGQDDRRENPFSILNTIFDDFDDDDDFDDGDDDDDFDDGDHDGDEGELFD